MRTWLGVRPGLRLRAKRGAPSPEGRPYRPRAYRDGLCATEGRPGQGADRGPRELPDSRAGRPAGAGDDLPAHGRVTGISPAHGRSSPQGDSRQAALRGQSGRRDGAAEGRARRRRRGECRGDAGLRRARARRLPRNLELGTLGLALSAYASVPAKKVTAVREVFLHMADDPEGIKVLEASAAVLKTSPVHFIAAKDADFESMRRFYRTTQVKVELH